MKVSKAQIAHLIGAVVVFPVVTAVNGWLMRKFPGLPHFNNEQVSIVSGFAGLVGSGVALHYLKGLREWEIDDAKGELVAGEAKEEDVIDPRFEDLPADRVLGDPTTEVREGDAGTPNVGGR